jgi:hypothetical protein
VYIDVFANIPILVSGQVLNVDNATKLPDPNQVPIGSVRVTHDTGALYLNVPITGWNTVITTSPGIGIVNSVNGFTGSVVLSTTNIPEGSNLYYLDSRARQAISGTAPISYNNSTGVISIPVATTSVNGYLSSTDWNTFNNKVSTTRTISTSAPLTGGGDLSANRTISIPVANTTTDGYLSSTDWNTFNATSAATSANTPNTIVKRDGTGSFSMTNLLNASGNKFISSTTRQIFDNNGNFILDLGTDSPTLAVLPQASVIGQLSKSAVNSTAQFAIQNTSTSGSASTDFITTADNGADTNNYADMGINASTFSDATWTINGGGEAYLYNNDAGLAIGANVSGLTPSQIKFFMGGSLIANLIAQFNSSGIFQLGPQTGTSAVQLQFVNSKNGTIAWNPSVNQTLTLPAAAPTAGAYLASDGSGNLSWSNPITNIDGGTPTSSYVAAQILTGGTP